jgi:hypothetical protein
MKQFSRIVSIVAALGCTAPFTMGCAEQEPAEQDTADTGTISAAISTVGPDGATYSMPAGTYLRVIAATWEQYYPIDGVGSTFSQALPAGDYTIGLYFSSDPRLVRSDGTVSNEVTAIWTDPQPLNLTVTSGLTTPLVLHFDTEGLENITFVDGTLDVSIEVDEYEGTDQPGSLQEDGSFVPSYTYDTDPTAQYAVELSAVIGSYYYQGVTLQATGPWAEEGTWGRVCVPVQVGSVTTYGDDGISRRMRQILLATGELCINDGGGTTDYADLYVTVDGPVPSEQAAYLPDASYTRQFSLSFQVPDLWDGTTLQQTELASWVSLDPATSYVSHYLYSTDYSVQTYVSGNLYGRVRLSP